MIRSSSSKIRAAGAGLLHRRITLPAAEVARLKDIRLVPGMPVEAFIQTHERTPLQYLLKPLRDQVARTFRER